VIVTSSAAWLQNYLKTRQPALIFINVVAERHILRGAHPRGLWPPNSNLAEIICTVDLLQLSSSYVYSFGSYRVDKHTNKQTDAPENIQRSSIPYDVG